MTKSPTLTPGIESDSVHTTGIPTRTGIYIYLFIRTSAEEQKKTQFYEKLDTHRFAHTKQTLLNANTGRDNTTHHAPSTTETSNK